MKLRNLHTAVCLLALVALLLAPLNAAADEPAPDGRPGLLASSSFLPLITRSRQPAAPAIHSFTANPATIVAGAASTLSWQVTGATSLSITPGVGTVTGSSVTVSPAATTQYTLHASNALGTTTAQATVTVNAAPPATGGFFLFPTPDVELPTSHPTMAVDPSGGTHVAFTPESATQGNPARPAYYAYCPASCTAPANWYETRLLDDSHASDFDLAFGPNGQPRLVYATYDSQDIAQQAAYAECQQNCHSGANWSGIVLANTASASVSAWATFDLALDSAGKPRLALYTGTGAGGSLAPNSLYYLACDAAQCAADQAWSALRLNLPQTQGEEGVALALDSQNRPRIGFHAPLAAGFGLHFAWCNATCATSAQAWQAQEVEASEEVNAELPIPPWPGCPFPQCNPPIPPCTLSSWDSGVRPALALDGAGNPRIAYDAEHRQGGACGTFTDTKLTRFIHFNRP